MIDRTIPLLLTLVASAGCGGDGGAEETPFERGRAVYASNCTACHAMDPGADGPLGPAVVGSSRELLEARVIRGDYPGGYQPKRDSRVMAPLPHLLDEIDSLTAYLNSTAP